MIQGHWTLERLRLKVRKQGAKWREREGEKLSARLKTENERARE